MHLPLHILEKPELTLSFQLFRPPQPLILGPQRGLARRLELKPCTLGCLARLAVLPNRVGLLGPQLGQPVPRPAMAKLGGRFPPELGVRDILLEAMRSLIKCLAQREDALGVFVLRRLEIQSVFRSWWGDVG